MTTYIKVMSHENLPDSDPSKGYAIYTVGDGDTFRFALRQYERSGSSSKENCLEILRFVDRDKLVEPPATAWEITPLLGNAYVMNDAGKTIGIQEPFKLVPKVHGETNRTQVADNDPSDSGKEQLKIMRGVVASLTQLSKDNIVTALATAAGVNYRVKDAVNEVELGLIKMPGKITREDSLRSLMKNGRMNSDELFRQSGRSGRMLALAKAVAKTAPVVIVTKDAMMRKAFIERLGQDAVAITVIVYDPRYPTTIDWEMMQVMGDFIHHQTFIDHDVIFMHFKKALREYWKYDPEILVKGNVLRLDLSDMQ